MGVPTTNRRAAMIVFIISYFHNWCYYSMVLFYFSKRPEYFFHLLVSLFSIRTRTPAGCASSSDSFRLSQVGLTKKRIGGAHFPSVAGDLFGKLTFPDCLLIQSDWWNLRGDISLDLSLAGEQSVTPELVSMRWTLHHLFSQLNLTMHSYTHNTCAKG